MICAAAPIDMAMPTLAKLRSWPCFAAWYRDIAMSAAQLRATAEFTARLVFLFFVPCTCSAVRGASAGPLIAVYSFRGGGKQRRWTKVLAVMSSL